MNQRQLFNSNGDEGGAALLLSIRSVHSNKIFEGQKLYELRKSLPRKRFTRVYLYESGGRGIVGCFEAGEVIQKPVHQLWEAVGERATTRERFVSYFKGWQKGYAIEIQSPIKFDSPILPAALRDVVPTFTAPQSYLLLQPTEELYGVLEDKRREQMGRRPVHLMRIALPEQERFISLVTSEISRNYDEITPEFARMLLRLDALGEDPNGIFTTCKEIFSVLDPICGIVGFTTLTFKLGGSAKTGPTILFPEFRGKGYGTSLRREVIRYVKGRGVRKLYCTCPDTEYPVIRHLLGNGLEVEAHLASHYRVGHGELVFGLLLDASRHGFVPSPSRTSEPAVVKGPQSVPGASMVEAAHRLLNDAGYPVSLRKAEMLVHRAKGDIGQAYEEKPLDMACLVSGSKCVGLSILIPKRGGATKGIIASDTSDRDALVALLAESETRQRARGRRKLYFAHPITDNDLLQLLLQSEYRAEGVLQQPYTPGLDAVVMSKYL